MSNWKKNFDNVWTYLVGIAGGGKTNVTERF